MDSWSLIAVVVIAVVVAAVVMRGFAGDNTQPAQPLFDGGIELNPEQKRLSELKSAVQEKQKPAWTRLPEIETVKVVRVGLLSYRATPDVEVSLGDYTCQCDEWQKHRAAVEPRGIGRCCPHIARAILADPEIANQLDPTTRMILCAATDFGPPISFAAQAFSNGAESYLAMYDIKRGYVQLYGPEGSDSPFQYGYDISQNRWAHAIAPPNPLAIKKQMRPWIKTLDSVFRR